MKAAMVTMLAGALFNLGVAHAAADTAGPGYDRVGRTTNETPQRAHDRAAAPGENAEASVTSYPARKREMARRLVWLMLSAR